MKNTLSVNLIFAFFLIISIAACSKVSQDKPEVRTLSEQNLVDILVGSCIQSTRNCDPSQSIAEIKKALAAGEIFTLIQAKDIPAEDMVIAVQGIGGGGPWQYVIDRTTKQGLENIADPRKSVVELFRRYSKQNVAALVRSEAAGATATALLLSAQMNIPILDGGITGRAVPEVQQSIPWINGISSVPTAIITPWGDEIIIAKAVDEYRVEDIARAIAVASAGDAWISMTPMSGSQLGNGVLAGNISQAELFGRTVREARENGKDPIAALVDVAGAYKLFEGVVSKSTENGDRGFNWVDAEFEGTGEFSGQNYKMFVKNENIVGWLDGELNVMAPDYIYNLDPETGESTLGVGYGGYVVGEKVAIVAVPAPAQWRSKKGIELIGPRHFGFDFDFIPIEKLQEKSVTTAP
ncbi:DUF917 domain-containing protein [Glaciecola petra]|uniref:DUF917 domain-containing protein n=1 Tax=Glaciecola petra TaxID=3075602 RepID=A0ABU2ZT97_9ALTE|nr:DUF917 domain-containing protein [Aestuariibacter sp. P117]MDT0595481.1 DUF917 domain-containing protein [Aestuariibacter sp. P117]